MAYEIKAIRVSAATDTQTSKITHVKLESGTVLPVPQVIFDIKSGARFFYTTSRFTRAEVEIVRDTPNYIRTKANLASIDNLLSLPKF